MKNYVISLSPFEGGLSCRINCLVSAMKFAEKTGRKLIIYWPKNHWCNCTLSDLFENNFKEIYGRDLKKIIKSKDYKIYIQDLKNFNDKKKFILINSSKFMGFSKENIQLKFKNIPKNIQKDILNYLGKLKINKKIQRNVDGFYNKFFKGDVIGIHLRKGDFKLIANNVGNVSSDEKFIEEIEKEIKINPKIKFLLATEDKETEEKFKKIFDKKIIVYPKKTKKRNEEGAVEEALIELLLLSKCKKISGSFGSTFTEMAWWIGECKPEIKIIIDKKELEVYKKKEKRKNSFLTKIKKIVYEIITPLHIRILDKKE